MKNRNRNTIIILACLGAAVGLTVLFFSAIFISGNNLTFASCYVAENGYIYMVYDGRLVGLNGTGDVKLSTGDKAFIIFGSAFAESYPESTRAVYIVKIADGEPDELGLDEGDKERYEELGFVFE